MLDFGYPKADRSPAGDHVRSVQTKRLHFGCLRAKPLALSARKLVLQLFRFLGRRYRHSR